MAGADRQRVGAERNRIRAEHLRVQRPGSSGRGAHHVTLLCSDVERTIRFYQDLLEFPLTEILDGHDPRGSSHVFFDIGNGNLLAFVDRPGLDLAPYVEALGGVHHIAISVEPAWWQRLRDKLDASGVPYRQDSEVALCFQDPDGAQLELLADPLGELSGLKAR